MRKIFSIGVSSKSPFSGLASARGEIPVSPLEPDALSAGKEMGLAIKLSNSHYGAFKAGDSAIMAYPLLRWPPRGAINVAPD